MSGETNRYKVEGAGSDKGINRSGFLWSSGSGAGNRADDQKNSDGPGKVKNGTASEMPSIAEADLSMLKRDPKRSYGPSYDYGQQSGVFRDTVRDAQVQGTAETLATSGSYNPLDPKAGLSLVNAKAAIGARDAIGVRGMVGNENVGAKGEAYAMWETGASGYGKVGLDWGKKDGFGDIASVGGAAHIKAGVGAKGDADAKHVLGKVGGVDFDAGVGVHGDVFAGAKAGLGGKAGIGMNYIGAEGKAGALLGVEANADIHGNLGPVGGKVGVSGIAGIGAGIEGGIKYENGKVTIGGKMFAALGYGGGVSGEVTLDIKKAGQMLHGLADRDGDGKLSIQDAATGVSQMLKGGAGLLDKTAVGAIGLLDGDGDGKFSGHDLAVRAGQMGDALGSAKDKVLAGGKWLLNQGQKALDRDGDGKLSFGDVTKGLGQVKDAAMDRIGKAGTAAFNWADHNHDGKVDVGDVGAHLGDAGHSIVNTGKAIGGWIGDKASSVGHAIHDAADLNHDGKVDGADAMKGLSAVGNGLRDTAKSAINAVSNTLDINGDGKVNGSDALAGATVVGKSLMSAKDQAVATFHKTVAAGQAAFEAGKKQVGKMATAAYNAADRDGDGKLGLGDVAHGAGELRNAAAAGLNIAGRAIHNAADVDGDGHLGWNDVTTGAKNVGGAIVGGAKNLYHGAADSLSNAASTIGSGISDAAKSVSNTWHKATDFFGW